MALRKVLTTLGVTGLVGAAGCAVIDLYATGGRLTNPERVELRQQEAQIAKEQAEILAMYKRCLQRKERNPLTDCSEYRTALEITVKGSK